MGDPGAAPIATDDVHCSDRIAHGEAETPARAVTADRRHSSEVVNLAQEPIAREHIAKRHKVEQVLRDCHAMAEPLAGHRVRWIADNPIDLLVPVEEVPALGDLAPFGIRQVVEEHALALAGLKHAPTRLKTRAHVERDPIGRVDDIASLRWAGIGTPRPGAVEFRVVDGRPSAVASSRASYQTGVAGLEPAAFWDAPLLYRLSYTPIWGWNLRRIRFRVLVTQQSLLH